MKKKTSNYELKTIPKNNNNNQTIFLNQNYNNIEKQWLPIIKCMIIFLVIKSVISFFFIYYKLLAKMKLNFIDLNIEQYLDILNYHLFILFSYVYIFMNKNRNYYLLNFNKKNYIKLYQLFVGIQIISLGLMIKYDYFCMTQGDDASAENPIKAFYIRIYYSFLFLLLIFFNYNKKLYTESLTMMIPSNFDNIKFVFFNFFFFINDSSERMVLLLFTIPSMIVINYYIRLSINHNDKDCLHFYCQYNDNKSSLNNTIEKNDKNKDEFILESIYTTVSNNFSVIQANDTNNASTSFIDKKENVTNCDYNISNQNMEIANNIIINNNNDERHKNYCIYLIFCVIAINFVDNMTCVLMKQFSFDISLRAGNHTIGAKLEDFPLFTGVIFVFHKLQNYILISVLLLDNVSISKSDKNIVSYFSITIFMLLQIKLIGSVILNVIIIWIGIDHTTTFVIYSGNYVLLILFFYIPAFSYLIKVKYNNYFIKSFN